MALAAGLLGAALPAAVARGAPEVSAPEPTPVRTFRVFDRQRGPGLPQSTAMGLVQDEKGILWIATLDGLAWFDGGEIHTLQGVPSAPASGALLAIARRPAGGVYAGGSSAVFVYDQTSWRQIPAPGAATGLAEDDQGQLWRIDRVGKVWWRPAADGGDADWQPAPLPAGVETAVLVASGADRALWLAGRRRVARRQGGQWRPVAAGQPAPAAITALLPGRDGRCWLGTQSGAVVHAGADDAAWTAVDNPDWRSGWIRALAEDLRGRVWAGGNGGGVAFGRVGERWTHWDTRSGLFREATLAVLADREGSIWFSANGHGLQQWIGEAWSHRVRWRGDGAEPSRTQVFGITGTADGGFLAAVFNRGLWHWDGRTMHEYGAAEGLVEDVRGAVEAAPGTLWVAARFGIFEGPPGGPFRRTLTLPSGFVYSFIRGADGTWLAATSTSGVLRREAGAWRPWEALNAELPDANVRALLGRADGTLWVGTLGGLAVFEVDGERVVRRPETPAAAQVPKSVNALLEVDGEVWIGGFGGIGIVRADGSAALLRRSDGVPGNTVYALARATDGAVWAGGSNGAGRFQDGSWTRFDSTSGLIEDECNHTGLLAREGGWMLVGTMASLAHFDAGVTPVERPPLRLYWRQHPLPGADGVARLAADRRTVHLAWHAPWSTSRPIEYRTRIPRLAAIWSPVTGETGLQLEILGPGRWEVEVAARFAGESAWIAPIVSTFWVAPRWWETRAFRVGALALAALAVVAVVHWRTRRLAARAQELEHAVRASLAQIKVLGGLLPICASCKKVRDDAGYWRQIETYIRQHSEAEFSHGLCPECLPRVLDDDEDETA